MDKSKNQIKLLANQVFKSKLKKLVIPVVSGQVSRNWNILHNHCTDQPVVHHLQFSQPPEGASSRLRRLGNNCPISIVGRYSKVPQDSIQDKQRDPNLYCHLTHTDFFSPVVVFPCDLKPQGREE